MGGVDLWQGQMSEEELKRFPPFIKKYFFVRGSLYAVVTRYAQQWNDFLDNLTTAGWRVFVHDVETDLEGSILPGVYNKDMDFSLFMWKEGATAQQAFEAVDRAAEAVDIGFFKGVDIWKGQVWEEVVEPTLALRPPGGKSIWPWVFVGVGFLYLLNNAITTAIITKGAKA